MSIRDLSPSEAKDKLDRDSTVKLLDVRTPEAKSRADIGGDLIPVQELEERLQELNASDNYIIYCHHGGRSAEATRILQSAGFTSVWNLAGGIDRWSLEVDSTVTRY